MLRPDPESPAGRELYQKYSDDFVYRANALGKFASFVVEQRGKSLRAIALGRLLDLASKEMARVAKVDWTREAIKEMAWATRNLMEVLVLYEDIRGSDKSLLALAAESLRDEIDIYSALKVLSDREDDRAWCDQQIAEIETQAQKAGLVIPKKYRQIREIAESVGFDDEYKAVYSLYSKWVHPTAWQIGSGGRQHAFLEDLVWRVLTGRLYAYSEHLLNLAAEDQQWVLPDKPGDHDRPLPDDVFAEEIPPLEMFRNQELGKLLREMDVDRLFERKRGET